MQVSTCWAEALKPQESLQILKDLALRHSRQGGVKGSEITALIEADDWKGLCEYELSINDYSWQLQLYELIQCRQALGLFTKFEELDIGVDKEAVAYDTFVQAEALCKETNRFFRSVASGSISLLPDDCRVLHSARRKIARILGPCPQIADLTLRFGPGATTSTKKRHACPQNKFANGIQCSANLFHSGLLPSVIRELPHWTGCFSEKWSIDDEGCLCEHVACELSHGQLQFVPKNAKTYRAIVVEPTLNGMLQAGIGDYIKRRLKRSGIDITDQSRNKTMARLASIDGAHATLDLSSASDTISREVVKDLIPDDWYLLLSAARSGSVTYHSHEIHLEKFSSMGNGFSFPLETLLFWALTASASNTSEGIGVYGDDIICPTSSVGKVSHILDVCGFVLNKNKSFTSGPFRESCGGDYYMGIDTRPYYQKYLVSAETLFTLHNFYVQQLDFEAAEAVKQYIPSCVRIYGPPGYGDGHLHSADFPRLPTPRLLEKGYCGFSFETYSHGKLRSINRFPGDYVSPLYSIYTKDRAPLSDYLSSSHYTESTGVDFSKSGRPFWTLPGKDGYKKVRIYTLT